MARSIADFLVGLFVLLGACALVFLALQVANLTKSSGDTYTLWANFSNIGALKPRAPVKSAGVVVGRVESIVLEREFYEARVKLAIDSAYQFPSDTFASIFTSGLLGEQYVGLDPGGEEQYLSDGGEIEQTQPAIVLEKLVSQFFFNQVEKSDDANADSF